MSNLFRQKVSYNWSEYRHFEQEPWLETTALNFSIWPFNQMLDYKKGQITKPAWRHPDGTFTTTFCLEDACKCFSSEEVFPEFLRAQTVRGRVRASAPIVSATWVENCLFDERMMWIYKVPQTSWFSRISRSILAHYILGSVIFTQVILASLVQSGSLLASLGHFGRKIWLPTSFWDSLYIYCFVLPIASMIWRCNNQAPQSQGDYGLLHWPASPSSHLSVFQTWFQSNFLFLFQFSATLDCLCLQYIHMLQLVLSSFVTFTITVNSFLVKHHKSREHIQHLIIISYLKVVRGIEKVGVHRKIVKNDYL